MSISFVDWGDVIAIRCPGVDFGKGQVRVHEFNHATDEWEQLGDALDGTDRSEYFGSAVSLNHEKMKVINLELLFL